MDIATSLGLAGAGFGRGPGARLGAGAARTATHAVRAERAEQALKDEGHARKRRWPPRSAPRRDVAALQAEMASRIEKLNAEHRAESEKLARHLTEAYDELDSLRAKAEAAKGIRPGDTGYGFAKDAAARRPLTAPQRTARRVDFGASFFGSVSVSTPFSNFASADWRRRPAAIEGARVGLVAALAVEHALAFLRSLWLLSLALIETDAPSMSMAMSSFFTPGSSARTS